MTCSTRNVGLIHYWSYQCYISCSHVSGNKNNVQNSVMYTLSPLYQYIFIFISKYGEGYAQTLTSKVQCKPQLDATDRYPQALLSGCMTKPSTFYFSLNQSLLHVLHLISLPTPKPQTSPMHRLYWHLPQSVTLPPPEFFLIQAVLVLHQGYIPERCRENRNRAN